MTLAPGSWRRAALTAFIVAQALFWGFAWLLETKVTPGRPDRVAAFAALRSIAEPSPEAPDAALRPVTAPGDSVVPAGEGSWALMRTRLTPEPGRRWAALVSYGTDSYRVYLNGRPVGMSGETWPDDRSSGRDPTLFVFEPEDLKAGENRLDFVVRSAWNQPTLRSVFIGPYDELHTPFVWRGLARHQLLAGAAAIALWSGLLAVLLAGRAAETAPTRYLGFMLLAWFLWAALVSAMDLPISAPVWSGTYMLLGLAVLALSAAFTVAAVGARPLKPAWFVWGFLALAAVLVPALVLAFETAFPVALAAAYAASLLCFAVMLVVLLRRLPRLSPSGWMESVAVAAALTAGVVDTFDEVSPLHPPGFPEPGISLFYTPYAGALLGLAFIWSLARRALEAESVVRRANDDLSRKVAEKERELAAHYSRAEAAARLEALGEERQRIMRDMHDGIGGQLLGLILQARGKRLSSRALVAGLETSLEDLQLVVDSLDQGEASLEAALGAFRARIEPRCEAAEVELVWRIADVGPTRDLGPAVLLQVYRLLQEACANALRHGRPRRIEVSLGRPADAPHMVEIALADDGKGFDPASARRGLGLRNMRLRAERAGGSLEIRSGEGGTTVALRFAA